MYVASIRSSAIRSDWLKLSISIVSISSSVSSLSFALSSLECLAFPRLLLLPASVAVSLVNPIRYKSLL